MKTNTLNVKAKSITSEYDICLVWYAVLGLVTRVFVNLWCVFMEN